MHGSTVPDLTYDRGRRSPRRPGCAPPENSREHCMLSRLRTWWQTRQAPAYGRREPLVLVNGLAEQAESWYRNIDFWRQHFDVYTPNLIAYDGAAMQRRIDAGEPIDIDYLVEQ